VFVTADGDRLVSPFPLMITVMDEPKIISLDPQEGFDTEETQIVLLLDQPAVGAGAVCNIGGQAVPATPDMRVSCTVPPSRVGPGPVSIVYSPNGMDFVTSVQHFLYIQKPFVLSVLPSVSSNRMDSIVLTIRNSSAGFNSSM
jgi:hypothetical protein